MRKDVSEQAVKWIMVKYEIPYNDAKAYVEREIRTMCDAEEEKVMKDSIVSRDQILELRKSPEAFANMIVDVVNVIGNDVFLVETAELLTTRAHRTNQQTVMRLVAELITNWASLYREGRYDDRNEDTCRTCKVIDDTFEDGMYFRCI